MKTIKIKVKDSELVYGRKYGVTKAEARKAYIEGFKEGMKKHKSFWKDIDLDIG